MSLVLFLVNFLIHLVICNYENFCEKNYFKVNGMSDCHPLLTCADLPQITLNKTIGYGAVKHVFLANWGNVQLAYSILKNKTYSQDFNEGLKMLKMLNPSKFLVQLVGYCERENIILTEYHPYNNANNILYLLENRTDRTRLGLQLCLNYAQILNYLHNSPVGIRVNCDSNGMKKLLSQFLIKSDISLILNDLDALPEITNKSVNCGHEILSDQNTNSRRKLKSLFEYTDKSDVYKFPNVCEYFFKGSIEFNSLQYSFYSIHKKCKNQDASKRPTSSDLMAHFKTLL